MNSNLRLHRAGRASTALVALAVLATLTGCGFRVVSADEPDVSYPATPSRTTASPSASPSPDGTTYEGLRSRIEILSTTQLTCGDEPLRLTRTAMTAQLIGSCPAVIVQADSVQVLADNVDSLVVSGTGVTVVTRHLTAVTFDEKSTASEAYWVEGHPRVTDNGTANTALQIPEN